jgi:hypothetical protein
MDNIFIFILLDSGGPLTEGGWLVGVVSFTGGSSCGNGFPDGFERVSSHLTWIRNNMV